MIAVDAQSLVTLARQYQLIRPQWTQELVIIWLLGQWAISNANTFTTPVLTANGGEIVSWTNTLTPAYWNIYQSFNGGVSYSLYQQVAGSVTSVAGLGTGNLAYVVGVNASNVPVTNNSNIITVT